MKPRLGTNPMGGRARPMLAAETLVHSLPRRRRMVGYVRRMAANREISAMGEPCFSTVTSFFPNVVHMCRFDHITAQTSSRR